MLQNHAVVVGLHLRWDGVWQRPQHILSRFARHCPVVILEEPLAATRDLDEILRCDGVTVVRPHRARPRVDEPVDHQALRTISCLLSGQPPVVWLYTPMMLSLAGQYAGVPIVYDCMDDLASFERAPRGLRAREALLMNEASLVFTGGRSLFLARARYGGKVRLYASGVDYDFFAGAATTPPHPELADLPKPVYGYIGVVDERIDRGLLRQLAASTSGTVAVVGPTAKIDPDSLPRAKNIVYLGLKPYADLPALMAGFDVALMPFALNDATRSISPTKTLEYLAAGLPVVSTPVADVVADYRDIVDIASGPGFVAACTEAANRAHDPTRGQACARAKSWDAIAERMRADLEFVLDERHIPLPVMVGEETA